MHDITGILVLFLVVCILKVLSDRKDNEGENEIYKEMLEKIGDESYLSQFVQCTKHFDGLVNAMPEKLWIE
jgi:hypothetical protein